MEDKANQTSEHDKKVSQKVPEANEIQNDTQSEAFVKAVYDIQTKRAIASTSVIDRQGESIDQAGWELRNFKKNPVLLWGHDHMIPSIGMAKNIKVEGEGKKSQLTFEPQFNEITDLSKAVKQIFEEQGGTFSVGFQPIESEGSTYTKQELLEISAVNVPANPEARMMAYKSLKQAGFKKTIAKQVSHVEDSFADMQDRVDELEKKVSKLAKGDQPQVTGRKVEAEKTISEAKVIAKAMDKLLGNPSASRSVHAKVAKRAAEKLIVRYKEQLKR